MVVVLIYEKLNANVIRDLTFEFVKLLLLTDLRVQ